MPLTPCRGARMMIGMSSITVPLFPLRTVLFPEGPLPLRVFEARYLDMVSQCMKGDSPFGVVEISISWATPSMRRFHNASTLNWMSSFSVMPTRNTIPGEAGLARQY